MRLVAWNILQGAPKRGPQVASALLAHSPDLVILTEFHPVKSRPIAHALESAGLRHQLAAPAGYGYEVFMASRAPLRAQPQADESVAGGYLEAEHPEQRMVVAGVYVPVIAAVPLAEKRRFWGKLHDAAHRHRDRPYLVIGDWNTGDFPLDKEQPTRAFTCTREYRQMKELGFEEAWRSLNDEQREYTWTSNRGHGFRIDHAFLSPMLRPRLVGARYSHDERYAKISDHSVMIVELLSAAP